MIATEKGDMDKGFNQLMAEMIALAMYEKKELPGSLYGAVSIGELWRFGILDREEKSIYRDLYTYRVPEDMEKVLAHGASCVDPPGNDLKKQQVEYSFHIVRPMSQSLFGYSRDIAESLTKASS